MRFGGGRCAPAAFRYALLSALRSTDSFVPLADRRPKPSFRKCGLKNSSLVIEHWRAIRPRTIDSAMKSGSIVWRRRSRQGYYGSARLDARASVPPLTRPPPPGVLPLGFHRGKLSLFSFEKSSHGVEQIASIARRAIEVGVDIQTLSSLVVRPIERAGIVLGYGGIATDRIEEGLRRLRRCFLN